MVDERGYEQTETMDERLGGARMLCATVIIEFLGALIGFGLWLYHRGF